MNLLYYRVYLTILRMLFWLGNDESDSPRYHAALIMTIFTLINVGTVLLLFSVITRIDFITDKRIFQILFILALIGFNWYVINKKRGKEAEKALSNDWEKDGNKNILITICYFILSVLLIGFSFYYADKHPLK